MLRATSNYAVERLEAYLCDVRYANNEIYEMDELALVFDLFLQYHRFLSKEHTTRGLYELFRSKVYEYFQLRGQTRRDADMLLRSQAFVEFAHNVLSNPQPAPQRLSVQISDVR